MTDDLNTKSNRARIEPRTLKGFRDFGPEKQTIRQSQFNKIQTVFERFGFLPMSTPVLEYKEILMGKYGEDEKLVYSFKDNGDRDVAMRYDLTVPLARFIAQNQGQLTFPFKRYQIAPVWRADNTQKGRFREFYQCDVDAVGTTSPLADAEVIACLCLALEAIDLKDYTVRLNDRRNFEIFGEQSSEIVRSIDKFDKIGIDGVVAELETKNIPSDKVELAKNLITGQSEFKYKNELGLLRDSIIALGVTEKNIVIDPSIARGLDYYTSTVFEIILKDKPEFGSICGGGRYDSLVDQFSDQPVSAVGGSIGIDRLLDALEESGSLQSQPVSKVFIINMEDSLQDVYIKTVSELRSNGINSELYYEPVKIDKQFKYAESKDIPYAIIIGQDEASRGVLKLKNLSTREQEEKTIDQVIKMLK